MSSTAEHVYAWLKGRAELSDGESYTGDEQLEEALLRRESDLIDLGLAHYGCSMVVSKLFAGDHRQKRGDEHILGSSGASLSNMKQALRLAALSNRILIRHNLLERMPHMLLGVNWPSSGMEPIREFVTSASIDEIMALFRNPTIYSDLLASLYEKEDPFEGISEERWQRLIMASAGNARLRAEYLGPMDGWAEYKHSGVFNEAWALADRVPTTQQWAVILALLLEETTPECFSIKDEMGMIQRWNVDSTAKADGQAEPGDNYSFQNGYLDAFGTLRLVLARLLADSEIQNLRTHEDIAMRCAFYKCGSPTREELMEAHVREPKFLLTYAIRNDALWMVSETRDILRELCWAAGSDDDLWFPNAYRSRSDRLKAEHPEWFLENQGVAQARASAPEVVMNALSAVQVGQADMRIQIANLQLRVTVVLWIACIVLALILFGRL